MHKEIERAIQANTAASVATAASNLALLEWLNTNAGAATKQDISEMEKRIIDAIKADADPAILKAASILKTSTDQLEKVVVENQPPPPIPIPISG